MIFSALFGKKTELPTADEALPGRATPILQSHLHPVLKRDVLAPLADGQQEVLLGMGCFWGAERLFWQLEGVHVTAVGYAGGHTPNPTYEEVCSGMTGHAEVVRVVFEPARLPLQQLLEVFWEAHDPTQGMRQGNDRGTQYRSCIYADDPAVLEQAGASREAYQAALAKAGLGAVTTEIRAQQTFYPAESMHQQYLYHNPGGYCGLAGTGVRCPDLS